MRCRAQRIVVHASLVLPAPNPPARRTSVTPSLPRQLLVQAVKFWFYRRQTLLDRESRAF
jgi:hypothetical protein